MRHPPGFTLLEILVAFAIAALALVALTAAVTGGLRASRTAAATEQAISRAQSRLAAALAPSATTAGERSGDDGGGFRWRETVRQVGRSGAAALYDITVEITWAVDGPHRLALHTMRLGTAPPDPP